MHKPYGICWSTLAGGLLQSRPRRELPRPAPHKSASRLEQAGSSFILWVCCRAALASTSKSSSNPGAENRSSRTSLGTLATRFCSRATFASTCKSSFNPRASNASTPRRVMQRGASFCWVCYRATLASFSCCNPSATPRAGKARERSWAKPRRYACSCRGCCYRAQPKTPSWTSRWSMPLWMSSSGRSPSTILRRKHCWSQGWWTSPVSASRCPRVWKKCSRLSSSTIQIAWRIALSGSQMIPANTFASGYEFAACRLPVLRSTAAAAATEHGTELSKAEVTLVFKQYMEDLKTELRPDQLDMKMDILQILHRGQNETHGWTHLRGQRHLDDRPSSTALVCYRAVLNWLDRLAGALQRDRATSEFQDAQRKGRRGTRRVGSLCYRGRGHAQSWRKNTWPAKGAHSSPWERRLLDAYRQGSLQQRLVEVKSKYQGDPMHRSPLPPWAMLQSMLPAMLQSILRSVLRQSRRT